jgi:hypothetical protein
MDQLRILRTHSDVSKTKSQQALSLVEAFAMALFELNGGHSGSALRLDFLSTIVGDARQLDQIVNLLIESMRGAISSECRLQVNGAAEELTNSIRPITEGLRHQLLSSTRDYQTALLNMKSHANDFEEFRKLLARLEGSSSTHDTAIRQLQRTMNDVNADSIKSMISAAVDSSQQQVSAYRKQQDSMEEELRNMKRKLSQQLQANEDSTRNLAAKMSTFESHEKDYVARIQQLEDNASERFTQLGSLESKLSGQNNVIESMQRELSALKSRMDSTTTELSAVKADTHAKLNSSLQSEQIKNEVSGSVDLLNGRLETVEMRTKDIHESITEELQSLRAIVTTTSKSASTMQANSQAMIATVIANLKETIMASVNQQCAESKEEVDRKLVTLLGEVVGMVEESKKALSTSGILPRLSSMEHKQQEIEMKLVTTHTAGSEGFIPEKAASRESDVDDIQKEVTMLHNAQAQLSDAQDEFTNRLDRFSSQMQAINRSLSDKEDALADLREKLESGSSGVATTVTDSSQLSDRRLAQLEAQLSRFESSTKLAMDALQEEMVSLSSKMESIGNCDDEGCGVALNCESKIDALTSTVSSLQTFVNSSWKSVIGGKTDGSNSANQQTINSVPPPPPVHPSLTNQPRQRPVDSTSSGATRPSDVLTAMLQPATPKPVPASTAAADAPGSSTRESQHRTSILSQLKESESEVIAGRSAENKNPPEAASDAEDSREHESSGEDAGDDHDEDEEENEGSGPETDDAGLFQCYYCFPPRFDKCTIFSEDADDTDHKESKSFPSVSSSKQLDDSFEEEDEEEEVPENESAASESESESSTEERVYGSKRPLSKSSKAGDDHASSSRKIDTDDEFSDRLNAEHERAKLNAAARTPQAQSSAVTEASVGPKPVLSGSLQKRRVNTFPNIDTSSSTTPATFGSYSMSPYGRTDSARDATAAPGIVNTPHQYGLNTYNRDEKPLFQTLAADNSAKKPATREDKDEDNDKDDENHDDSDVDEDAEEIEEESGASGDEESGDEESSVSSASSEEPDEPQSKPPHRPPVNDPAALTRAAAMRAYNSNAPIGTKISNNSSTISSISAPSPTRGGATSPSSVFFSTTPRGAATSSGPPLSVLAGMGSSSPSAALSPSNASAARSASPYGGASVPSAPQSSPGPNGPASAKGIQCPHCLRRVPQVDITSHTRTCDLRPESCKFGCGAKILYIKLNQHYETCPNRHQENARIAASLRAEALAESRAHEENDDNDEEEDSVAEAKVSPTAGNSWLGAKKAHSPKKAGQSPVNSSAGPEIDEDHDYVEEFDSEEDDSSSDPKSTIVPKEEAKVDTKTTTAVLAELQPRQSGPHRLQPLNNAPTSRRDPRAASAADESFDSSSDSLGDLWAMADQNSDNSEGEDQSSGKPKKSRRKRTPPGLSALQQESALSATNSRKAVSALNAYESDEADSAASAQFEPKHRNKLTDKIRRGAAGTQNMVDKKQANDDDN